MKKSYQIVGLHCGECLDRFKKDIKKYLPAIAKDFLAGNPIIELDSSDARTLKILAAKHKAYVVEARANEPTTEDLEQGPHRQDHSHDFVGKDHSVRNIGIAFFLNLFFSIAEFFFGRLFNSHAIMADAVHDLGDALAIGVSLLLQKISKKEGDTRFTDGYGRFSLLGSLFTGSILLFGSTMIIVSSIPKIQNPQPVNYQGMLILGIVAVAINLYAAWLMRQGASTNEKMLSYHMLEDLFGWMAIIVLSLILRFKEWYVLDPILSILISSFIFYNVLPELLRILRIFMNRAPENVDVGSLEEAILAVDHVHAINNIHTHSIEGQQHVFSAHLFVAASSMADIDGVKDDVKEILAAEGYSNVTLELTLDPDHLADDREL